LGKLRRPVPTLLTAKSGRSVNPVAPPLRIVELFHIPGRYLRSVHLERDFEDTDSLRHYVVTVPMVAAFARIMDGLRPESGHRAWRITGDYGTGKSSFALVLAHLLRDPTSRPHEALVHFHETYCVMGSSDSQS
jgi:hypothetical protein